MIFLISLAAALFWLLFTLFIFYVKQRPEAQVRRRINILIQNAVEEREKNSEKTKKISLQEEFEKTHKTEHSIFYKKFLGPIFDALEEKFQKFAPSQIKNSLEEKVFQAGKLGVWNIPRIISFWTASLLIGTFTAVAFTSTIQLHFLQEAAIILFGVFGGAIFPLARLNKLIAERKKIIRRTLPEFLDLLCVSVQAGLSFDGAISKISSRMTGPLIDEFKKMQSDVSLGMTRQYALTQVARRCNLEEMYLFTSSVIQAEKLGTSMGRTLKIQADNMRDRHRQFIKAEAMRAPIKILFPMILFIFPSIFVVLLFPAILELMKTMGE